MNTDKKFSDEDRLWISARIGQAIQQDRVTTYPEYFVGDGAGVIMTLSAETTAKEPRKMDATIVTGDGSMIHLWRFWLQ